MKLTANISLDELIKSQVAERKGINNNPSPMQIENLKALAINILQPIRSEFDRPLIISSGFRTAELCIEIGSKITSEHCADNKSAAADFEIPGIDNKELAQWIKRQPYLESNYSRVLQGGRTFERVGPLQLFNRFK
jgi:zinc D-Ala-D-Ala carboxypeptidase